MTNDQFRADFTEFASKTTFTESALTYWLNLAGLLLNGARWGNLLDTGTELFMAHNLVLEAVAQQTVNAGGIPGLNKGSISAEGAGKVNISYDTNATLELGAGHWNHTVYGTRFIRLARLVGAGPIHVGADSGLCAGDLSNGTGPWWGPPNGSIPGF